MTQTETLPLNTGLTVHFCIKFDLFHLFYEVHDEEEFEGIPKG